MQHPRQWKLRDRAVEPAGQRNHRDACTGTAERTLAHQHDLGAHSRHAITCAHLVCARVPQPIINLAREGCTPAVDAALIFTAFGDKPLLGARQHAAYVGRPLAIRSALLMHVSSAACYAPALCPAIDTATTLTRCWTADTCQHCGTAADRPRAVDEAQLPGRAKHLGWMGSSTRDEERQERQQGSTGVHACYFEKITEFTLVEDYGTHTPVSTYGK